MDILLLFDLPGGNVEFPLKWKASEDHLGKFILTGIFRDHGKASKTGHSVETNN